MSSISPTPTDEEAAAIVAALQLLLLENGQKPAFSNRPGTSWRFSGRWWEDDDRRSQWRPAG